MNPKEFPWDETQNVTVINPTEEDFDFLVHSKAYRVPANSKARMPGFIAWKYVYDMAAKLAQARGQWHKWNEEGFRPTIYDDLVDAVDGVVQEVQVEPEPAIEVMEEPAKAEEAPETAPQPAADPEPKSEQKPAETAPNKPTTQSKPSGQAARK